MTIRVALAAGQVRVRQPALLAALWYIGTMVPMSQGRPGDHDDDATLVERFERLALPPDDFGHREHVRVAFAMLRGADFGEAAVRYRAGLRRFAAAAGAAGKYHETLTWAFLAVINQRMAEHADADSAAFLARNPDLLVGTEALGRYYDVAAIVASPFARRVFVLPGR